MNGKFVGYFRVSTTKQQDSGLGLEAQQKAVADFLNGGNWRMVAEFIEVESGRRKHRPQLEAAIAACRKHRAKLVIAKLDRLARNAAFLLTLRDSGVEFVAADMPHADKLTVGIMAVVAEHERDMISRRTREALAAAKRRGVKLGSPCPQRAAAAASAVHQAKAQRHAENVYPVIADLMSRGERRLIKIADALNARGIQTARGRQWYATTVRNLIERVQSSQSAADPIG